MFDNVVNLNERRNANSKVDYAGIIYSEVLIRETLPDFENREDLARALIGGSDLHYEMELSSFTRIATSFGLSAAEAIILRKALSPEVFSFYTVSIDNTGEMFRSFLKYEELPASNVADSFFTIESGFIFILCFIAIVLLFSV